MKATTKGCVIAALVIALCGAVFAQSEADFTVELTSDGSGAVITKYTGTAAAVKVPAAIEGFPVKELRGSVYYNETKSVFPDTVTSVDLPAGITKIGAGVFADCYRLASLSLPAGVTEIEARTFANCRSLATFTVPSGVTRIGEGAFSGCSALTSVSLPKGLADIGRSAFSGCSKLASVTLPAGITVIKGEAFSRCESLASITIPEGVTSINAGAFAGCSALTTAALPASIKRLGDWDSPYYYGDGELSVFSGCGALTSVTIPDSVTAIGLADGVRTYRTIYGYDTDTVENLSNAQILFPDSPRLTLVTQARLQKLKLDVNEREIGGR